MSSYIRKYDLVEVSEYPSYLAITDNIHIFNKFISIMKSSVIVYEGLYGVRLARGEYKDIRMGVALYGFGQQNALWFLREALQKGARVIIKAGFGLNFGESRHPVIAQYAFAYSCNKDKLYLSIADYTLLSIMDWQLSTSEIEYSIENIVSCGNPIESLDEKELSELRKRFNIKVMDTDTAYIYDYLNRWKAKALSIVFPFVWAESYPEIGLWFNYEPTSKDENSVLSELVRLILDTFVEYHIRLEAMKKKKEGEEE
jgi:hypothetical protein